MNEVPEDIMAKAVALFGRDEIAAALLAERERATKVERERCAKVVENSKFIRDWNVVYFVANAIRSGEEAGEARKAKP